MIRIDELREEGGIEEKRRRTCEGDYQPVKDWSARQVSKLPGSVAEAQRARSKPEEIESSGKHKPSKQDWQEFTG
jgi:hypothetical protein